MQCPWPWCLVTGDWDWAIEGPGRLALISWNLNFLFVRMYAVESEGEENLAGRGEAREKSQAGSPR